MNLPTFSPSNQAYTLPKMLELQETPLNLPPETLTILQPKYDGCQAIFIPTQSNKDIVYVPVTRNGNVIIRLLSEAAELTTSLKNKANPPVLFTEYEPVPWTDSNKAKLAGNLYTPVPLPFGAKVIVFDAMNSDTFFAEKMRATDTKERLVYLDSIKSSIPFEVSPWKEVTYKAALDECKGSRIETEEGTRCTVLGVLCEGGVIRYGMKGQKEKPTIDKDVAVLHAVKSPKGQAGWLCVDTKDTTAAGLMVVFGGVNPTNHLSFTDKVVEVKMLTVSGFKGAGNPTFARTREFEKTANTAQLRKDLAPEINKKLREAKVEIFPSIDR